MWNFRKPPTNVPNFHVVGHLSFTLILTNIVLGLSVIGYGFDDVLYNTIQAMTPFEKQFGDYNKEEGEWEIRATPLAFLNSFPLLTYAVGVILGSQIGERYGRRPVLVGMQFLAIAGLAVTYTSKTLGQMIAGRCLMQAQIGMQEWLVPMLMAEITPAVIRGSMVALFVFEHQFGAFICSIITYYTSKHKDNSSWQIPVATMIAFPCLVLATWWLVPESPRWLLRQDRFDDAVNSLHYLYGYSEDYSAAEEAKLLQESLIESSTESKGEWKDLFKGTNARRTHIAVMAAAMSMLSGNAFTASYGTVFLKQLGTIDAFAGTLIKKGIVCIGPITNMLLVERIGRRWVYLIFGSMAALALLTMGGLGTHVPFSYSYKTGVVAMSLFFPYARIVSFGATGTLMPAEVPHNRLRDKTAFLAWMTSNALNFVTTFTIPYLLNAPYANLGAKVGYIYGSFATIGVVWGYFCLPELLGRSLEEVEEMFEQKVPAWRMRNWKSSNADSVGARITALEREAAGTAAHHRDKLGETTDPHDV